MIRHVITAVERAEGVAVQLADRIGGAPSPASAPEMRVPPGPPPRRGRVFGSLGYYLNFLVDPIGFVGSRFERYGDIYYAPSPDGGLYGVKHPDHLYEVLVTRAAQFDKTHSAFRQLSTVLGGGLLNADGETWRRHRRMMQPAFAQARIAGYASAMTREAISMRDTIGNGETLDVDHAMMELTLRVVSRALFSHDAAADTAVISRTMTAIQGQLGVPDIAPRWVPVPGRIRLERAIADLDKLVYGMIAQRRDSTHTPPDPPDLLHMLVTAIDSEGDGSRLTEREVRDEIVTLFLAGHETTANALTWTWYLLSQNPEAEAKLHRELDEVLGDRAPGPGDLEGLPYTEQVIKEAMRLYPPVFVMARRAREDAEIGGYPVPKGSEVVLWLYMTHRDPRWYPEPDVFRPERFEPEQEAKLPKLAHVPFGAGPRVCIGKNFAMMEARLLLATLAQRFRFELAPGQRIGLDPRITLRPKFGMRMIARRR